MKILLLDDESFMLKLLERQLANLGFTEVMSFERPRDALALLTMGTETVGLIFCDLQMPEIDGVEFVRYLLRIGYGGGLVLVSGEDERIVQTVQRLAQAHALNVLGALQKPVSPELLRQLMQNLASSSATTPRPASKSYEPEQLQRAIAGGELVNHYQPKVDISSGALVGVETLVRWQHPQDGLVYPDQFIRIAEEHGLIDDVTRVVLAAALRQAGVWQNAGLSLHVAVNISMDNLGTLDFPDRVAQEMEKAGVALSSLVLEVTESRLMKDPLASLDILTRLRLKRIGLSIDDFGTGYSSLAQLRDIPFDELKIDRGFVHGAWHDPSLKAIVEASCSIARDLGMKIVAEGVEDRNDWDFLRAIGCDIAQGYFIAKPMPATDLFAWIKAWEARRPGLATAAS